MTIITACRRCGIEFEPDRAAIVAGTWRLCPACRRTHETGQAGRCQACGRELRGTSGTLCLSCLTGRDAPIAVADAHSSGARHGR